MAESEDSTLGALDWTARLQLDELTANIAEADRKMEALHDRWADRSFNLSMQVNDPLEKLQRTGGDTGQQQQLGSETPLGTLQRQAAEPVALNINTDEVTTAQQRMEELNSTMANVRREVGETTFASTKAVQDVGSVAAAPAAILPYAGDDRDRLASDLERRMKDAAASGNWGEVKAVQQELASKFAVMGEKPRPEPLLPAGAAPATGENEPDYREAYRAARVAETQDTREAGQIVRDRQIQSTAELEHQLSSIPGRRDRAATIRTAALDEEENSPRQLRMLSRANLLDQQDDEESGSRGGGTGGHSRLASALTGRLGTVGSAFFAAYEVKQAIGAFQNTQLAEYEAQKYGDETDQLKVADSIARADPVTGLRRGVAAFAGGLGAFASDNGYSGLQRVAGGLQAWGDDNAVNAVIGAQRQQEAVQNGLVRTGIQRTDEFNSYQVNRSADVTDTQGGVARQVETAHAEYDITLAGRKQQIDTLQTQYANAEGVDRPRADQLKATIDQLQQDQPAFEVAAARKRNSSIEDIARNEELNISPETALANGEPGRATQASYFSGLQRRFGGLQGTRRKSLMAAEALDVSAHEGMIDYGVDRAEEDDSTTALRLAHRPQEADLNEIEIGRKAALAEAPVVDESNFPKREGYSSDQEYDSAIQRIKFENGRVTGEVNDRFDLQKAGVQQDYAERGARLNSDLGAQGRQTDALRGIGFGGIPNPIAAQAIGIGQSGFDQAVDLDRAGFGSQGLLAGANTRGKLEAVRTGYLNDFHGVQVDPLRTNLNNPRNRADVAGTLRSIDQAEAKLPKSRAELDQAAGVQNVPKGQGGTGGGVLNMSKDELRGIIKDALDGALAN